MDKTANRIRYEELKEARSFVSFVFGALVPAIILIVTISKSYTAVEAGHVGVVKLFGAVDDEVLEEGFHLKNPLSFVTQVDSRLGRVIMNNAASSKDLQTVTCVVETQYSLKKTFIRDLYVSVGKKRQVENVVIKPAIKESVKSVTAKFTAEELIKQRETVKQQIKQSIITHIDTTLTDKQVQNSIDIANVALTEFKFSYGFNKAIEEKVKAEQEALEASNKKAQRITEAEARAEQVKLAADAQAYATITKGNATATAIIQEAQALQNSEGLIRLRQISKWDGGLPKFFAGANGVVPFFQFENQ